MVTAAAVCLAMVSFAYTPAVGQLDVTLLDDMVLDSDALLMPLNATYGRSINGVAYQSQPLLTYNGYQYATWYHLGSNEDVYMARRDLSGTTWETLDTGANFTNGDASAWDAHNIISMGVSGDGKLHLSWDHHGHTLRYMNTVSGVTTSPGAVTWNGSLFNTEQDSLNVGGATITGVTYPRFISDNDGDMFMAYRTGGSGNGDMNFATYDAGTGLWDTPHQVIGSTGTYSDALGTSTSRNGYTNGFDVGPDGTIHVTWTWRESAGGANHDINYAYSNDGGDTWRNNAGTIIGTVGSPITINSPGIIIDDGNAGNGVLGEMDRRNTLMNQQTQAVDLDGRVHAIMWHADDAHADSVSGFTTAPAAYFHYYRDPVSGEWARTELPTEREVGSRPQVGYDADGNLYAIYVSPGAGDGAGVLDYYTDGDLVIAGATKASGYTDWSILHTDTRDFSGEPLLDQQRLLDDGVLSVFIQENDDAVTGATGTPLHVLDFNLDFILTWAGDGSAVWDNGVDLEWDTNADGAGNALFSSGKKVVFNDTATSYAVNIANPVAPGKVTFNNSTNAYTFTGAGIGGAGELSVNGGGTVTLANSANTYTGDTNVNNGTLALSGAATIAASPNINVTNDGTLDVSGLSSTFTLTNGQTLNNNSNNTVVGDVDAGNGSTIAGTGTFADNVTAQAGSVIRVGAAGMPSVVGATLIDDFESYDNSGTTSLGATPGNLTGDVWIGEWDGTGAAFVTDDPDGDQSLAVREGSGWRGAETDLANNFASDVSLADGDTATYFYQVMADGTASDAMTGLTETRTNVDINNPWQDFAVMPYVAGGNLKVYGGNIGDQTVTSMTSGDWYNVWVIVDNASKTFDMYWSTGTDAATLAYSDVEFGRVTNPGNLEAFAIMNNGTDLVHVDNLYKLAGEVTDNPLTSVFGTSYSPQTLTIEGDLVLETGSVLALDIATSGISDLMNVVGSLTAGGTLEVTLDPIAPTPQLGDAFDILDFATASGSFDAYNLPSLGAGLFWDTSDLLSTGILEVVAALAGDLDSDGFVGITDLNVVLSNWNQNVSAGDTTSGDPSGDGFVGIEDLNVVLGNWNNGTPPASQTNIPEPASVICMTLCLACLGGRRSR